MPLDCEESVGHSCGCPFGLSSETGLLVTTSFSGSDRMDNVLKDHRRPCPSSRAQLGQQAPATATFGIKPQACQSLAGFAARPVPHDEPACWFDRRTLEA